MSEAGEQVPPLRIRGTPRRLSALVPDFQPAGVTSVEVSLRGIGDQELPDSAREEEAAPPAAPSFAAFVLGTGELRLNLPRGTPPGVYEGSIRVGDRERQVTVEVEPKVRLRLFPKSLRISGAPGERIAAELTLINEGNAPADIRTGYSFWLVQEDAADRVLGRLFETSRKPEMQEDRLERVLDAVSEQYGGNVRVKIHEGAGELAPGSSRELRVDFILPERLQPGQRYDGMWHLHDLHWSLHVTVTGETQEKETPP